MPTSGSLLDAANFALVAYGARCQHSDLYQHPEFGETAAIGWLRLLRDAQHPLHERCATACRPG